MSSTVSPGAPRPTPLLVFGIDAGDPALLEEWIADGSLPHLAALVREGACTRARKLPLDPWLALSVSAVRVAGIVALAAHSTASCA